MMDRPDIHARLDNDFGYHPATPETGPMHDEVRERFKALVHWLADFTPPSREQSLMFTALQEAQMWANAAIAVNKAPLR